MSTTAVVGASLKVTDEQRARIDAIKAQMNAKREDAASAPRSTKIASKPVANVEDALAQAKEKLAKVEADLAKNTTLLPEKIAEYENRKAYLIKSHNNRMNDLYAASGNPFAMIRNFEHQIAVIQAKIDEVRATITEDAVDDIETTDAVLEEIARFERHMENAEGKYYTEGDKISWMPYLEKHIKDDTAMKATLEAKIVELQKLVDAKKNVTPSDEAKAIREALASGNAPDMPKDVKQPAVKRMAAAK